MVKYLGANRRWLKQPFPDEGKEFLRQLRSEGANAVAFNVMHYFPVVSVNGEATLGGVMLGSYPRGRKIFPDIGQSPKRINETTDIARIWAFTEMALDMGFEKVLLKPLLECYWSDGDRTGWRGHVRVPHLLKHSFFEDYLKFILPYAQLAQEVGCDLCMGTELRLVSLDHGPQFWINMAGRIRDVFSGEMTYAANWGSPEDGSAEYKVLMPLFDSGLLNYAGMDMYHNYPDLEAARVGMTQVAEEMKSLHPRWYATEVGWPNTPDALQTPWGSNQPENRTFEVSSQAWSLFREIFDPVLEGFFAWEAGKVNGVSETHDILGTPVGQLAWSR